MKYLACMLMVVSTLNIFGDEDLTKGREVVFVQCLTFEQQEEVAKMRTEFLEGFNEIRNKMISIKMKTQNEMRKENPDWNEIKKLKEEYSKLQNILNEGMLEYKEKVQNIQIEIVN